MPRIRDKNACQGHFAAEHREPRVGERRSRRVGEPECTPRVGERVGQRGGELAARARERDLERAIARRAQRGLRLHEHGRRALEQRRR
jgi:hypothetical protein